MSTSADQLTHYDLSSPAIVVQEYVDAFNRGDEDALPPALLIQGSSSTGWPRTCGRADRHAGLA